MSIRVALTRTTTDALSTVSAATRSVTTAANSLANYSEMLEVHSGAQLAIMKQSYALDADVVKHEAEHKAKDRIVRRQLSHQESMKDPEYAELYSAISFS